MAGTSGSERRRYERVLASGSIVLHGQRGGAARGLLENLSVHGALARLARSRAAPVVGERVQIDLHLDAAASAWLTIHGRVVRSADSMVAVAFDAVEPELEDAVQQELLGQLEARDALPVIIVDPDPGRRGRLAAAMRDAGCHVVEAAAPLDAIASLQTATLHAGVILIADTVPARDAELLDAYVREAHPRVHRARIDPALDLDEQVARLIAARR